MAGIAPGKLEEDHREMKILGYAITWLLILLSVLVLRASLKLGLGTVNRPGPGFMPLLVSLLVICLSLIVFITDVVSAKNISGRSSRFQGNLIRPIILVMALSIYTFSLNTIGYLIATYLLVFSMITMFDPKKWYLHTVIAAVIVLASYILFVRWLQVQLPTGLLG